MLSQADSDGLTGDTMSMQHSEQQSTIPTIDCMNAKETITSKTTTIQDKKNWEKYHENGNKTT